MFTFLTESEVLVTDLFKETCISFWWSLLFFRGPHPKVRSSLLNFFGMLFSTLVVLIVSMEVVLDAFCFACFFLFVSLHGCTKSAKCAEHVHQALFPHSLVVF